MLRPSLEERKEYIANLAARVFCEKGYQTASLQDVAQIAKISKAGLYHYFRSKEDILAFLLIKNTDRFLGVLRQRIQMSHEMDLDPRMAFQELIRTYADYLNRNKEVRMLVLRERHQLTGKNKRDLFKREQAIFDDLVKSLKRRISVIPAKAGIQLFQILKNSLDSGFHRSDDFLRDHHLSSVEE